MSESLSGLERLEGESLLGELSL